VFSNRLRSVRSLDLSDLGVIESEILFDCLGLRVCKVAWIVRLVSRVNPIVNADNRTWLSL